MFSIVVGEYTIKLHNGGLPIIYDRYVQRARLVEEFDKEEDEGEKCVLAIQQGLAWPFLIVTQNCKFPGIFDPSVLLVPETKLVFVGAGERLLAYELNGPTRLWEDVTECGLWGWARHGESIVMSAELELAAWDLHGGKRWTTFVEPPWEYEVLDGTVHLDVMGQRTSFPLETGPQPLPRSS